MISGQKRKAALVAVIALLALAAGCGGGAAQPKVTTGPATAPPSRSKTSPPPSDNADAGESTTRGPVVRIDHGLRHFAGAGSLAAAGDGAVFVSYSFENPKNANRFDFALVRFSRDGREIWRRTISADSTSNVPYTTVRLAPDGNPILAGSVFTAPRVSSAILQKYTPDGELVWEKTFGEPDRLNYIAGLAFTPNGQIVVASYYFVGESHYSLVLYRLDQAGDILNQTRTKEDCPNAIAVDGDRTYVVGVKNKGFNEWNAWIARYDSNGKREAYHEVREHLQALFGSLAVAPDRSVYIAGFVSDKPYWAEARRGIVLVANPQCRISQYFEDPAVREVSIAGLDTRYLYVVAAPQRRNVSEVFHANLLKRLPFDEPALQEFVALPPSLYIRSAAVQEGREGLILAQEHDGGRRIVLFRLTPPAGGSEAKKAPAETPAAAPTPLTKAEARALATKLANTELAQGRVRDTQNRPVSAAVWSLRPERWGKVVQRKGRWELVTSPVVRGVEAEISFNLDGSEPLVKVTYAAR